MPHETLEELIGRKLGKYGIPNYMHTAIKKYLIEHKDTGGFFTAVVKNDLKMVVSLADNTNIHLIPQYVKFLYNEADLRCWGSEENVKEWTTTLRKEYEDANGIKSASGD